MYWNNPVEHLVYPSDSNILFKATHHGQHCLYYDPAVDIKLIHTNQKLLDLCLSANQKIQTQGMKQCLSDPANVDWLANIVKINLWVNDLPKRGSIKPMLLVYNGHALYNFNAVSGTGSSRLKAIERVSSITHVSGFITTNIKYQEKFQHLESITDFNRFAEICGAHKNQQFWLRLTNDQAEYGIDWYEYDSHQTTQITPSKTDCINALGNYLTSRPDTLFVPSWFDQLKLWNFSQWNF
jgi:hypothetical protein